MTYLFVVFCPVRAHRIPGHHLISYDPALNQRTRLVRFRGWRQAQEGKGGARPPRAVPRSCGRRATATPGNADRRALEAGAQHRQHER